MAISKYKIKKWFKMIKGDSILHVNQSVGELYEKDTIKGYYNNLTEKVTNDTETKDDELPKYHGEDGVKKIFPIGIFQYGLGSYDLYLKTKDKKYLKKFDLCVEWAIENQDSNGGWKTFEYETPQTPYSAMAQGEAISLLARAYVQTNNKEILAYIKNGMNFLMESIDNGGVSSYTENLIYLKEFIDRPVVLNGWIFAIFGIYDYLLLFPKDNTVKDFYNKTLKTLTNELPKYDLGYWSKYDLGNRIASPFYHKLHIAQLEALYNINENNTFEIYKNKFLKYNKNKLYKLIAFIRKALQKIME